MGHRGGQRQPAGCLLDLRPVPAEAGGAPHSELRVGAHQRDVHAAHRLAPLPPPARPVRAGAARRDPLSPVSEFALILFTVLFSGLNATRRAAARRAPRSPLRGPRSAPAPPPSPRAPSTPASRRRAAAAGRGRSPA